MAPSDVTPQREPLPRTELTTERLVLRPWLEQDIEQIFAICQDPEIQRWTTVPTPYRLEDADYFVRQITLRGYADGTSATFGAFLRGTHTVVGAIGIDGITVGTDHGTARSRQGEVGYWANPATRGRGYLTEALREVARWGFDQLGLQRLTWQAFDGNEASWRVAQKAGFRRIGLQRSSHVHRGKLIDMLVGDLLPADLVRTGSAVGGGVYRGSRDV
jgi:RimJ/RimL family protein N-acetyltransferase